MPQRDAAAFRRALTGLQGDIGAVRQAFTVPDAVPSCDLPHRNNREWCALSLNDAWHRFCRRLVISSAICGPQTLSGTVVQPVTGLRAEFDVLGRLRKQPGPPRPWYWEPHWHDAVAAGKAARFLQVSNAAQIVAALGSSPSPASDLNTVRNFIAHRKRDTASKMYAVLAIYKVPRTRGMPSAAVVDGLLSLVTPTGTCFLDWCDQLERIAVTSVT